DVTSPAGGGGEEDDDPAGDVGLGPIYPTDGAACSFTGGVEKPYNASQAAAILLIFIIILVFSTARPLIRQTY
ncbi:unnamed protein product, partial [marine sediment metagenome]